MTHQYTVGSLFAGIGGICLAFKQAGCKVLWANELDRHACITYRHNFPEHTIIEKDIHLIKEPAKLGKVDIITSGFPCQAFSVAGYRKGLKDDRGNLFLETARFVDELKPKAFLLENVKNLVGHDQGRTFKIIKDTFEKELNYSFIPFILNAKDYGDIPQNRERIYVVGFKNEAGIELFKYKTMQLIERGKYSDSCTYNFSEPEMIKREKEIHDLLDHNRQHDTYYYGQQHSFYNELIEEVNSKDTIYQWRRVYVRENKNNVCPTLTANMGTGGHNVPIIMDDYGIRKLTPDECLRFMGFPRTFKFPDAMANCHRYKQAGNSVVISVVSRVAIEMIKALDIKYMRVDKNKNTKNGLNTPI